MKILKLEIIIKQRKKVYEAIGEIREAHAGEYIFYNNKVVRSINETAQKYIIMKEVTQ